VEMNPERSGNGAGTALVLAAIASLLLLRADPSQGAPAMAPIVGEIERISLDNPADVWSGGRIVVGGDNVVIPRNLLIDLPANRLTLQQLFAQAPPSCVANGETGLAKADRCNTRVSGGLATIFANRTLGGDVIAGDVRIAKASESVTGTVTYVSYADGYFRLNGIPGDAATGVMVRVNDPSGRHTIQQGPGCVPGNTENCSADARFGIDASNYTFAFATGYPPCIPSVANGANAVTGTGDPFCPSDNRPGHPSPDSTRFAPVVSGDGLSATGNFERTGGVQFLSAHTVRVFADVTTRDLPTQPDYMIFTDAGWDAPPYPGSRVGARFSGATSLHDSRVDIFSVHYDTANAPHEMPLETTVNNPGNGAVVFLGVPTGAFDTVLDLDFTKTIPGREPCPDLITGVVSGISSFCSNPPTLSQNFRLMSPIAREVVGRTRHKGTLNAGVVTRDIRGNLAPNGQYLTPVGVEYPGMGGIDLGKLQTPFSFSGVPWNLDRRLSPGGCAGPCEGAPQPLSPFPFEGIDPRTQSLRAPVPEPNRILAYYPFGPADVLAWPPADPAPIGIAPVEPLALVCFAGGAGPLAIDDLAATSPGVPVVIDVLANDVSVFRPIDPASVSIGTAPLHGTAVPVPSTGEVRYTPAPGYAGPDSFTYIYTDLAGLPSNVATVGVTVSPASGAPVAVDDNVVILQNATAILGVLANDTGLIDPSTLKIGTAPLHGTAVPDVATGAVLYTPAFNFTGSDAFTYTIANGTAMSNAAIVGITVNASPPTAVPDTAITDENLPVAVQVLSNDTGSLAIGTVAIGTAPLHGAAVPNPATGEVLYTPVLDFFGRDTFTYTVGDGLGAVSAPATVSVTVFRIPVFALDDTVAASRNTALAINVLANDTGPINLATVAIVALPLHGAAVPNPATGQVLYTPALNFIGADTFSYIVQDNLGVASNVATVAVTVQ
jgi:hypothetical protein